MPDNIERNFAKGKSPEVEPSFRAVKVEAKTVGEAIDNVKGTPAGQTELDWVLANASKGWDMLTKQGGGIFYFPGAGVDGRGRYLYFDEGWIVPEPIDRNRGWHDYDRVVVVG